MRILRLELLRYGRFTDRVLNFRQNAGLHLVYGPNEAGKSSSLAAIGDLLFGFGKRTDFDFMHEASTLRVGAEIVSRGGGETLRFRRRRGNKNTLLSDSDDETPLQEDALVPYLGTLNREVFSRAFGLNSTTLREGGAAMLESEGEMGSALFAAASGLTGFARLRRNLEAEADAIFAPRPSKERRFYQLLERHEAAVAEEWQREVKSGDWRDLSAEIESIERQLAEIKARRLEVTTALGRLQRLKVLEPIISAVDTLEATLKGFEDLPEVPEGFVAECRAALEAAEGAQLQERMAAEDVEVATAALDSIVVDEVFLQNADRIVELFSRRGEYLSRSAEIPRLELECDEVSQRLGELAQRLGARDADELIRRLPPEAVLESAPAIIDEGVKLEAAIVADERRLADERGAIEEQLASEAVAGLADPKPWRDRLAALEPDLKRLNEQSYLETSYRGMLQKYKEAAARLVPQVPDVDLLGEITLPTKDMIGVYKASFERLLSDRKADTIQLENNERQYAEAVARLAEAERSGPIAYEETIRLLRADRDNTFALLKDHLLRRHLLISEELVIRIDQFEQEIAEADGAADQALDDAGRLSQITALRERVAELQRQRPEIEDRLQRIAVEQERTIAIYNQLFAAVGITPAGPDVMTNWLGQVEDLLAIRRDAEALAEEIRGLSELGEELRGVLLHLADNLALPGAATLPALALARLITSALDEMQNRWNARQSLEGARQATLVRIDQLQDQIDAARDRHRDWRVRYEQLLALLGLDRNVSPAGARSALAAWLEVPDLARERGVRTTRLAALRRETAGFADAVVSLAREFLPTLVELPPHGLIDVLRERAETARAAKARHEDARVRLEVAEAKLSAARGAREAATLALRRLSSILPEGANPRIEMARLDRREALRQQLKEKRAEFEARAEGVSEAAVRAELPGFDRHRAPLDVEDLERQAETLSVENNRLYAQLGQRLARRDELENGTGAELAAFQRAGIEADLVAAGRQWAVRKIAALMLGAAIEKHRESQSDPLMLRAGELFRTLTGESFEGVMQDYGEDDQPRLVGRRRGGERVPISGMSEGTRDQLYLALRLAYLEDYAKRSEPVPFIGDDIFQTFDDERTAAGIRALASTSRLFQPILFTHHLSVVAIARRALGDVLDYVEL